MTLMFTCAFDCDAEHLDGDLGLFGIVMNRLQDVGFNDGSYGSLCSDRWPGSATIAACEKALQWQLALEILAEVHEKGPQPNATQRKILLFFFSWPMSDFFQLQKGSEWFQKIRDL